MLPLLVVLFISLIVTGEANEINRPTLGVIRWDAWNMINGQYDMLSNHTHLELTPERFHYRLPFFAKVLPDNNVSINEDTQEIMNQEILYAKLVGFDYCARGPNWTYCAQYSEHISYHYCPFNPAYGFDGGRRT